MENIHHSISVAFLVQPLTSSAITKSKMSDGCADAEEITTRSQTRTVCECLAHHPKHSTPTKKYQPAMARDLLGCLGACLHVGSWRVLGAVPGGAQINPKTAPQTAPKRPRTDPGWSQGGPGRPKRRPRQAQDSPRGPQDRPRGAQDGPRQPKRPPRRPKRRPRRPKRPPRPPQDGPGRPKRRPKRAPRGKIHWLP